MHLGFGQIINLFFTVWREALEGSKEIFLTHFLLVHRQLILKTALFFYCQEADLFGKNANIRTRNYQFMICLALIKCLSPFSIREQARSTYPTFLHNP